MKRSRGRGGRRPPNNPNRTFDSSGPEIKIRGSAAHVYEKYLQMARDANSAGDRVMAENYLQHAEHYYRILAANQLQQQQYQQGQQGQQPQPGQPNYQPNGNGNGGRPNGNGNGNGGDNYGNQQPTSNAAFSLADGGNDGDDDSDGTDDGE